MKRNETHETGRSIKPYAAIAAALLVAALTGCASIPGDAETTAHVTMPVDNGNGQG